MAAIDALDVSRQQLYPVGVVAGEICSYLMSCHGLGRLCARSRRLIDGDCQAVEVLALSRYCFDVVANPWFPARLLASLSSLNPTNFECLRCPSSKWLSIFGLQGKGSSRFSDDSVEGLCSLLQSRLDTSLQFR